MSRCLMRVICDMFACGPISGTRITCFINVAVRYPVLSYSLHRTYYIAPSFGRPILSGRAVGVRCVCGQGRAEFQEAAQEPDRSSE